MGTYRDLTGRGVSTRVAADLVGVPRATATRKPPILVRGRAAVPANDNPYSESWFKTLKFAPVFRERFGSLADARTFMASFVHGYNHVHRHAGIGLNTAADVHYGLAAGKATQRSVVLATARGRNPERFSSTQDPKILTIPDAAWINKPAAQTQTEPTEAEQAAKHPLASSTLTNTAGPRRQF